MLCTQEFPLLLEVQMFSMLHTAAKLADATRGITNKISGMITDGAHNIVASDSLLCVRHIYCFAHV